MNNHSVSWASAVALSSVLALGLAGCKSPAPVDDSTLTAQVQQRLAADSAINAEPIQVAARNGVVTLDGSVSSNAARSLAATDAAGIKGVQTVVNNVTVNSATGTVMTPVIPPGSATTTTPLPQTRTKLVPAPRERIPAPQAPITRAGASSAPLPQRTYNPPPEPDQPPHPVARVVTLPAGSTMPVRITQSLDSATAQPGDTFSGSVATDIIADGMLLIPRGASVSGRVTEVHEAAHFKGSSLLTLELVGVSSRGDRISISTQPYSVEGKGRGKNTAIKTGVGAGVGAVLGGIFGGGKGAAIGAAAGGGTGAAINGVTRGEQVQIPSETVIRFVTTNSLAVRTATHAGSNQGDSALQNR